MYHAVFGPSGPANWLQECARAAVVFAYGLVLFRVTGRRVFGQWTALDIVVAIVMGSSLSRAITGNADLAGTLAAMTLLMVLHAAIARACARRPALGRLLEGSAIPLAEKGVLNERHMVGHGITRAGLDEALRRAGIEHAHEARLVVLEPSGRISVLR